MQIEPIAYFRSPLTTKFGIPRQGGLAPSLKGRIVFEPPFRHAEAVRGLDAFSHLWLIWEFSANSDRTKGGAGLTVRPPRLGGNERVGVFASRSPFRPNSLGLTCAAIDKVEQHPSLGPVIHVSGADLMDGTPIYDVKPYVRYSDSHPEARSGFVDQTGWKEALQVVLPDHLKALLPVSQQEALCQILALDPRPSYHHDPERIYGMPFAGCDVRFKVDGPVLTVVEVVER